MDTNTLQAITIAFMCSFASVIVICLTLMIAIVAKRKKGA